MSDDMTIGRLLPWKREWRCGLIEIAKVADVSRGCTPTDPHDADDFGCGYRRTVTMLEEDYDSLKDAVVSVPTKTPLGRLADSISRSLAEVEAETQEKRAREYLKRTNT